MVELWVEKYRPTKIEDFAIGDNEQLNQIKQWIRDGQPSGHLIFAGVQGTGKTSLAKLLFKAFGVPKGDILEINASLERNLKDTFHPKVVGFCSTWSLGGGMKYVLLDEADHLHHLVQPAMRGVMEKYHEFVRFILTCNYPAKIIPAIHSRCQLLSFNKMDREDFLSKMVDILSAENIQYDDETLISHFERFYPDLRRAINSLQQYSTTGILQMVSDADSIQLDYLYNGIELIKSGKLNEARKIITSNARIEEYGTIYRWMYQNLELWSDNEDGQNQAIVIIARYLRNDAVVADQEINLAACLVEIGNLRNQ